MNAQAVKAYLERAQTQANSALAGDLTSIKSITVKGDTDVTLHLTQTDYQIPLLLGQRVAQITSEQAAENPDAVNASPVGAGPFKVIELVAGSHAYFEKNPDYWNAANIKIDRVELSFGIDASTVVSSLQTGVYDFASPGAEPDPGRQGRRPGRRLPAGLQRVEHQHQREQGTVQRPGRSAGGAARDQPSGVRGEGHVQHRHADRQPFPRATSPTTKSRPTCGRTTSRRPSRSSPMRDTPRTIPG